MSARERRNKPYLNMLKWKLNLEYKENQNLNTFKLKKLPEFNEVLDFQRGPFEWPAGPANLTPLDYYWGNK